MAGWTERWRRVMGQLTALDMALSFLGTSLVALGVGVLWAGRLSDWATPAIVAGAVLVLAIKLKYWTRFWGGP